MKFVSAAASNPILNVPSQMAITKEHEHKLTFEQNEWNKRFRVSCTCGYNWWSGDLEDCKKRAAAHTQGWVPVQNLPPIETV